MSLHLLCDHIEDFIFDVLVVLKGVIGSAVGGDPCINESSATKILSGDDGLSIRHCSWILKLVSPVNLGVDGM